MAAPSIDVGWAEVERLTVRLAAAVRAAGGPFDRVVGIARGGLVPAVLLAARLGVRRVEAVQVRHYDAASRLPAPLVIGVTPDGAGPCGDPARTLVVDDVYESGGTLRAVRAMLPCATYAALVVKDLSSRASALGGVELALDGGGLVHGARATPPDRWVVFPWSDAEESPATGSVP